MRYLFSLKFLLSSILPHVISSNTLISYLGFIKLTGNMISGDVAMVTEGTPPLTRNCNIFPRFPHYFAVVASKYQCLFTDFMVCLIFVSYLHICILMLFSIGKLFKM